jgi:hypothetical protein
VLLYACLTQHFPYGDYDNMPLLRAIQEGRFEPPRKHRPELPERLEAIILRAMRVAIQDRFESIHALGQALWEFASPRGQAEWKNFYFNTPVPGCPPAVRNATYEPPAVDPTASLEAVRAFATTAPLRACRPVTEGIGATKTAAGARKPSETSLSDIAGESALSDVRDTISRKRTRRIARLRVVLLLVGAIAAVTFAIRRIRAPTPARPQQIVAPTAATIPVPSVPQVRAPPAAPTPAPIARRATTKPPAPRPKRHATRRDKRPTIDRQGIGIPAD